MAKKTSAEAMKHVNAAIAELREAQKCNLTDADAYNISHYERGLSAIAKKKGVRK
jgi:hypothetical protein